MSVMHTVYSTTHVCMPALWGGTGTRQDRERLRLPHEVGGRSWASPVGRLG